MRVKEGGDGGLILDGDIIDGIEEAHQDGRLVEAFVLLHGFIDWWMIALYQIHLAIIENRQDWVTIIDENPSWKTSLRRLVSSGVITEKEKCRLHDFNELRNKVIHRLIIKSYQARVEKVTSAEAEDGFKKGMELLEMLHSRTDGLVSSKLPSLSLSKGAAQSTTRSGTQN